MFPTYTNTTRVFIVHWAFFLVTMVKAKILLFIGMIAIIAIFLLISSQPKPPQDLKYVESPITGEEYLEFEYAGEEEVQQQTDPAIDLGAQGFTPARTAQDCETKEGYFRDNCFSNLALIKKDISLCSGVSDPEFRDSCIFELAAEEANKDWCMQLDYDIPDCLTEVALKNNDPKLCEEAGFERETCIQAASLGSFEMCSKLGINRGYCNDAVDKRDSSICANIFDASQSCFFDLAVYTMNAQHCEKTGVKKDVCLFTIAVESGNTTACNLLNEGRDNCIATIALNTYNPALCDQAGFERETCLEDIRSIYGE